MEGFKASLALGVKAFELDVNLTADGVPVLAHDLALNPAMTRDPAGHWLTTAGPLISSMTFAALESFDVGRIRPGSRLAALFPDQAPEDGARIPALTTVLSLGGIEQFIIELKGDPRYPDHTVPAAVLADAVWAAVAACGVGARVVFESFDWRGPRHLRRLHPEVRLAWLTRAETVRDARLWWGGPHPDDFGGSVPRAVAAEGGTIWAPDYTDLTSDLVAEAQSLGLSVLPWTVNDPAAMRRLQRWGVDGLITDRPDLAPSG